MPVYEYLCSTCGHQFEVAQRMTDDAISDCESCGAAVQRLLFAPAIHFKGTGFHNTDYGTKKRPKDAPAETKAAASSSDGAGASKEPASKNGGTKTAEATPKARAARGVGP